MLLSVKVVNFCHYLDDTLGYPLERHLLLRRLSYISVRHSMLRAEGKIKRKILLSSLRVYSKI